MPLRVNTRRIKIFLLLSLSSAVVNILLRGPFYGDDGNTAPPDDSRAEFNLPMPISTEEAMAWMAEEMEEEKKNEAEERAKDEAVNTTASGGVEGDCFRARNDAVPASRHGKLKPPYVNLGFPKIGSTSIHSFFACAGYRAMHYRCERDTLCGSCVDRSVSLGLPPFAKCGIADVYSQIDTGSWGNFAQVEYLEEIVRGIPNGTFFLTFRDMGRWYHSMSNWPPDNPEGKHMSDSLRWLPIKGFPPGMGKNREEFGQWFCSHVRRVREVVARNPSQTLVEIDIEDPALGSRMAEIFDVDERCWGHQNVNTILHPGHTGNQSVYPWFVRGKVCIRGRTGMRKKRTEPLPQIPGFPPFNDTTVCPPYPMS